MWLLLLSLPMICGTVLLPSQIIFFFNKILGSLDVFLCVGEFLFQDIQVSALGNDLEIEKLMGSRSKEKVWKADVS